GLGDELHVGVLDAVVDHLDEVAGTVGADMGTARRVVDLGRDVFQERTQGLVRPARAAGHDARSVQRALLATGDTGTDEVDAPLAQCGFAPAGVGDVRVPGVD